MSGNCGKTKQTSKRGHNASDLARLKPSGLKQDYKNEITSKKDQNMTHRGLKRRCSGEEERSLKRVCSQTKIKTESSKAEKNLLINDHKAKCTETQGSSAQNRLALLRKGLKDTQSTSKPVVKKSSHLSKDNLKDPQVTSSFNRDVAKERSSITSKNQIQVAKPGVKSNFKIPKKSATDRLKMIKEYNLQSDETKKTTIGTSGSPNKNSLSSNRSCTNTNSKESPTIPSRKLSYIENSPNQGLKYESTNRKASSSKPETLFRFSDEYITISEASDSESSSMNLTPTNQRLTSIRNQHSSSSSDKTLTPGTPRKFIEETSFNTPTRPLTNEFSGLKTPLRRDLGRNRTETALQTEGNVFRSPEIEILEEKVPTEPNKNIFRNYRVSPQKTDNIFALHNAKHNNNNIVSQTTADSYSPSSTFVATTSPNFKAEHQARFHRPVADSFPTTLLNNVAHPAETLITGVSTDQPQAHPQSYGQSTKKSVTDRLNRIKNNSSGTYRKNHVNLCHDSAEKSQGYCKLMGRKDNFQEDPLSVMFGIPELKGTLQLPDSPNKRQMSTAAREILTEDWLSSHQGSNKNLDATMSDSMVCNVDNTIFDKSELPDPIEDVSMDWDSIPPTTGNLIEFTDTAPIEPEKENTVCIVTDTNIFMHSLPKVKDITNMKLSGPQKIKVLVPWMVIKELDHIKDTTSDRQAKSCALEGARYINKCLMQSDSKIMGQSVHEASRQEDFGTCPDDKILSCCLQAVKKYQTVLLLSNDINLRNKAIINNIEACTPQKILSAIKCVKFCKIRNELVSLWSRIICDCCQQTYGVAWQKMDTLHDPTLFECIKRFKKYWGSVFRDLLLKQSQRPIDGLHSFLTVHKDGVEDDSPEFKDFKTLVMDFSLFLQDLPGHKDEVKETVKRITKVIEGR